MVPVEQPDPFSAPTYAAPVNGKGLFFVAVVVSCAVFAAWSLSYKAALATPAPLLSAAALVLLEVIFNSTARFRRHGEHASYMALDAPVIFAMLLLLDWKLFVVAAGIGELLIAVSDISRRRNPTKWYLRLFNAGVIVVSGAAGLAVMYAIAPQSATQQTWAAPAPFLSMLAALLVYKILDSTLAEIVLALASDEPLWGVRVSPRTVFSESVVLAVGVPLALCWATNVWLSIFALLSLSAGDVLLGIPEMEYRLRIDRRSGLTNAATFDDDFANAVAAGRRERQTFALLVIDIDNFKNINDTHGHATGDWVIARFASVLAAAVRSHDTLARVGGEEFTIVLPDTSGPGAFAFAERLRTTIATTPFLFPGSAVPIAITASLGVSIFPDNGDDTRSLFHAADSALYAAKRSGRNNVRVAGVASNVGAINA